MKVFRVPAAEQSGPSPSVPRPWSQAEIDVVRRLYGKRPIADIAEILRQKYPPGRSYDAIRLQARRLRALGLL